jgi:hypothetical protein
VRQARWVVDEVDAERVVFNGGDRVENSQGQLLTMRIASRFELEAQAATQQRVRTKAGEFDAIQIVLKGDARRNGGALYIAHNVEIKLWYDPAQQRVVLFESEIRAGQNASSMRPSRERIELVRVVRAS